MLAKISADQRKPDGQFCPGWSRDEVLAFMAPLPTRKVPGVGRVQEKLLQQALGIRTCGELRAAAADVTVRLAVAPRRVAGWSAQGSQGLDHIGLQAWSHRVAGCSAQGRRAWIT